MPIDTSYSNSLLHIPNYRVYRQDRISSRGSGVCFYIRDNLQANIIAHTFDIEIVLMKVTLSRLLHITFGCVYRPPNSSPGFWSLLTDCLDDTTNHNVSDLIIMGDLNVNVMSPTPAPQFSRFSQFLSDMQLMNIINEPTPPLSNSCLDLILVPVTMAQGVHMDNTLLGLLTALQTITWLPVTSYYLATLVHSIP